MEAYCPQCGAPMQANTPCQRCAPRPVQQQLTAGAHELWSKVQQAGIAKVGLGLMAGSVIFYPWYSQRGIWASGWMEILFMLALAGYLGYREFTRRDPLPQKFWWAAPAAAVYLALWSLTGMSLKLGSLLFIAGAGLLAFAILRPWYGWLLAAGLNWRYALYGYRRVVLLGAVIAFAALFLTWSPKLASSGWWSGGYSYQYSSYAGEYVNTYDMFKYYNPGLYFASKKGLNLAGSVLAQAAMLACLLFAALAPQFAVPRWYRYIPLIAAGFGLALVLFHGTLYWGQAFFLVGIGLIGWGGYQLGVKGVAEGKFDLREVPLEKALGRWMYKS